MKILKLLLKPLLILLVFIAALALIGFLNQPSKPSSPSLTLSPAKGRFKLGQEFSIDIILNAAGQEINAADAVLSFNPQVLQVVEIKPGQVFPLYPRKNVDLEKNQIQITGVKAKKDGQVFTKPLKFATIIFKGKVPGQAKLNFVFSKGKTTGSTIIKAEGSENILNKVYNGKYEIN